MEVALFHRANNQIYIAERLVTSPIVVSVSSTELLAAESKRSSVLQLENFKDKNIVCKEISLVFQSVIQFTFINVFLSIVK